jgi:hypothetical protein
LAEAFLLIMFEVKLENFVLPRLLKVRPPLTLKAETGKVLLGLSA